MPLSDYPQSRLLNLIHPGISSERKMEFSETCVWSLEILGSLKGHQGQRQRHTAHRVKMETCCFQFCCNVLLMGLNTLDQWKCQERPQESWWLAEVGWLVTINGHPHNQTTAALADWLCWRSLNIAFEVAREASNAIQGKISKHWGFSRTLVAQFSNLIDSTRCRVHSWVGKCGIKSAAISAAANTAVQLNDGLGLQPILSEAHLNTAPRYPPSPFLYYLFLNESYSS